MKHLTIRLEDKFLDEIKRLSKILGGETSHIIRFCVDFTAGMLDTKVNPEMETAMRVAVSSLSANGGQIVSFRIPDHTYEKLAVLKEVLRTGVTSDAIRFCISFTTAMLDVEKVSVSMRQVLKRTVRELCSTKDYTPSRQ
mgnify:CR=1 FL=1